jgi:TonB-dependent starch-binding outer membrane protein SusC
MRKILMLIAFLSLIGMQAFAQTVRITGTVTGSEDSAPIVGASVMVKGTTIGTITDYEGKYVLNAPATATTLVVSNLGFASQEIEIGGKEVIDVMLVSQSEEIDEVVVIGYGSAKKVGTVVGSVSKVGSAKLEAKPQASVLEAIQGQVAGLQVFSSSGDPGTIQSVRLHGIGSLNSSNTPLYILDGIAISDVTFRALNPNDIENISVLKDASSTSIYGSRAANGVIYITTKRGSAVKSSINVRAQYGVSSLADKSFYDKMMTTEQLWAFWLATGIQTQVQNDALKTNLTNNGQVAADGSFHSTRWNEYIQPDNRPTFQADISILGGAKNTNYFISGSVYDEAGTAPGAFFKRYTLTSNLDSRVTSWFKTGANLRLSLSNRMTNSNFGTNALAGGLSFLRQPFYSPYDKDGKEYDWVPLGNFANPHYLMKSTPDIYTNYSGIINVYFEFEPIRNLKIKSVPGIDALGIANNWHRKPSYLGAVGNGFVGKSTTEQYTATITNTIEYTQQIGDKMNLVVLAGQEGIANDYRYYYARSSGHTDDRLLHLNNGIQTTYEMSSNTTESNFLSFFGRGEFSYDNRYFFDASIRNDQSSRFGKNFKAATFWSAGAMWKLKSENFMQDLSFVNTLDFKVSYGTQGNAGIGDFTALATIAATTNYGNAASWAAANSGNPDLTWETQKKLTVGLSSRLFNRVNFSVEYYNRATENMLMSVPIPATSGYTSLMKNVGTLTNNGIDLGLNIDILRGKDYYLGFNTVFNYNSEKITELFDGRQRWEIANTGVAWVVGKPVMFYYPIYAGVNPANGNPQWYVPGTDRDVTTKDPNNVTEVFNAGNLQQNTGLRRYAPISGGFSINGSWKGIGLSADFAYVLGKNLISNDRYFSENPRQFSSFNTSTNVLNYWKQPGDIVDYPDWTRFQLLQFDTHLIENATFCRLKNLTISYILPKQLIQKTKFMTGFKAFVTGRNLLTFKDKSFLGIDPEVDSNLTLGRVGNSKQMVVGFELTF